MTERADRIVIIGGGPAGLGAAHRLEELGHHDWVLLEASSDFGGLASSVVDDQGFTWDLGGHVLFSHYEYFDSLVDDLLRESWIEHEREAWVRMRDRWIPYPFQNNIGRLPEDDLVACIRGLIELQSSPRTASPENFEEWIVGSFGRGIADVFMRPYNSKVWAYPPSDLNVAWTGDRVATVDLARVIENVVRGRDEVAWGPNATFRFPASGGTGAIWSALARRLPAERMLARHRVCSIDTRSKILECENGEQVPYDAVISTMPLDRLLASLEGHDDLQRRSADFVWSSSHIVGIGLAGVVPDDLRTKCWMYFPEEDSPFYRATVFSNYADANVPQPGCQWSLMCEIAESPVKPVNRETVVCDTLRGLRSTGLVDPDHEIVSEWSTRLPYGYPTPFLAHDRVLGEVEPRLRALGIHSRGRFGGWKYEVSNQDHSLMQGVEAANHLLLGEDEVTWFQPTLVNGR